MSSVPPSLIPESRISAVLSFLSLVLFTSLILGYLWWGKFLYHHKLALVVVYVVGIAIVAGNHFFRRDTAREMGLRADTLRPAARLFGPLILIGGIVLLGAGLVWGRYRLDRWSDVYIYIAWAAVQQHLLQNFLRLRSEEALRGRRMLACILAALIFAALHLPNLPLTLLTFLAGFVWCVMFTHAPSFPWAWASHALLAIVLLAFFKHELLGQFGVGKPGYRFDFYGSGVKVAAGYDGNGNPFIATLPGPDKGVKAHLRVFDPQGKLLNKTVVFPNQEFSGEIAVGDLGFGPGDEIAVASGPGRTNAGWVQILKSDGTGISLFSPPLSGSGYGSWVSIGCKRLLVTPGPGPEIPQVAAECSLDGGLEAKFWDFSQLGFVNSVRVARICDGKDESAERLLIWASPISINPSTVYLHDPAGNSFRAIETIRTTFGANVTPLRFENGERGFAVAPGPLHGYPPIVAVVDLSGRIRREFVPFEGEMTSGSNIAAVNVDGRPGDELVLGEGIGPNRPSTVRVVSLEGKVLATWKAY